jgi:hypothetical protein
MTARRVILEPLEPRRLLSHGAVADSPNAVPLPPPQSAPVTPVVAAPLRAARAPSDAPTAQSVAGRFVGTYRGGGSRPEGFGRKYFDFKVVVTSVTDGGFVGSIATDTTGYGRNGNRREVAATFTGTIRPNGRFVYRLREPDRRVTFRGRLVPQTNRLIGTVRMNIGPGTGVPRGEVGGQCKLDRSLDSLAAAGATA